MPTQKKSDGIMELTRREAMGFIGATSLALTSILKTGEAFPAEAQAPQPVPAGGLGKYITIDGNKVYYEDRGQGVPIVMSAGGQNRVETLRPLAEKLAAKYRVITWDRANLGRSDLVFKGARDLDLWTDQLAELLPQIDARPAYFVGGSSGSRNAYTMALRYPDYAKGVFIFLVSGGGTIAETLGRLYYGDYADLAEKQGMEAVAKTPFWSERIELNPGNRQRLISMDPHEFARVMRRWQKAMRSNPDPTIGVNADDLRQLAANGTPISIVQGCEGQAAHRRDRSELFAQLAKATLIPSPPGYCEEGDKGPISYNKIVTHTEVPEAKPFRAYEMISVIPSLVDDFVIKTEMKYKQSGGFRA